ncbi:MAG TPA: ABC transporter permease, partial [Ktedonobacterales bacterium]|nr:ABC transporter permease [Ktedonobacterales bacterium]
MGDLLGLSITALAPILLAVTLAVCGALALLAVLRPHLARIGLRNMPRRPLRAALIVFGLMLATMFIAAAFAVDDTITLAVKTIAVFNLGRVDEEVVGRSGRLALYSTAVASDVERALANNPHVAGIAPALVVPNVLVADEASGQVRGGVSGIGLMTGAAGPLGDLRTPQGQAISPDALGPQDAYLNRTTARFLNARVGDTLTLYSTEWPGQRYTFRVAGVASGGLLGDSPQIVLPLATLQNFVAAPDSINQIYVANAGDGLSGVTYSDEIAYRIGYATRFAERTIEVKANGVDFALDSQRIFGRILTLFTLFALAIGLLLIFLIFVLLAAERRAELGMARAMGMRRGHVVGMLLYEGAAYDGVAALVGMAAGLGLSAAVIGIVSPTLAQIGF